MRDEKQGNRDIIEIIVIVMAIIVLKIIFYRICYLRVFFFLELYNVSQPTHKSYILVRFVEFHAQRRLFDRPFYFIDSTLKGTNETIHEKIRA